MVTNTLLCWEGQVESLSDKREHLSNILWTTKNEMQRKELKNSDKPL